MHKINKRKAYHRENINNEYAFIKNYRNNLIYVNKRNDIIKRFKSDYGRIISPELGKVLMKYFLKDESNENELEQILLNYKSADEQDTIGKKLRLTSIYEKNSLNDEDKKKFEELTKRVIKELNMLFEAENEGIKKISRCNQLPSYKKSWKARTPPYDCSDNFFLPLHKEGEYELIHTGSNVNGNLNSLITWTNNENNGEGSSMIDHECTSQIGIRLNNKETTKLKIVVKIKCTDYSFGYSSYNKDNIASWFYTNIINEVRLGINSSIEYRGLMNYQTSDVSSDPDKIGFVDEFHSEGDEMSFSFDFNKKIPANSILWIGLRNRTFSYHENLEVKMIVRNFFKIEEVRYSFQS